jgi:hypothetical protein
MSRPFAAGGENRKRPFAAHPGERETAVRYATAIDDFVEIGTLSDTDCEIEPLVRRA